MFSKRLRQAGLVIMAATVGLGLTAAPAGATESAPNEGAQAPDTTTAVEGSSAQPAPTGVSAEAWSATTPPQDDEIVYTSVEPTSDRILIDGAPSDIAVMPDFDAEAPVVVLDVNGQPASVDDASIVDIDGEVTELSVVSSTDRAALASCWRSWVAPGTGTWYNSVNGCAFIGLDAATTVGYSWTVDSNSIGAVEPHRVV